MQKKIIDEKDDFKKQPHLSQIIYSSFKDENKPVINIQDERSV